MRFSAKSDRGKVRELNEDSYRVITGYSNVPDAFIVADGMGGHSSGEVASSMAVQFAEEYILTHPEEFSNEESVLSGIKKLMEEANAAIYTKALESQSTLGMGTTFITVVMLKNKMYIGHVGDSRVYLIRDGVMEKVTTDHSFIEELIKNGSLTREEAENHPKRNIITRALGCEQEILVDTLTVEAGEKDIFVLCTDGLTNMLKEEEILDIVLRNDDPEAACNELVYWANEKGGEDNITVIVIKNS
ncbi:MAG: Stp1/IreP family PP2C-type Ser/Thr phosphatase [Clostridium sp.]|nr:Stp1/IreP family PP2C-type Ser/Thr phosphatase [Clostridium sp.]